MTEILRVGLTRESPTEDWCDREGYFILCGDTVEEYVIIPDGVLKADLVFLDAPTADSVPVTRGDGFCDCEFRLNGRWRWFYTYSDFDKLLNKACFDKLVSRAYRGRPGANVVHIQAEYD